MMQFIRKQNVKSTAGNAVDRTTDRLARSPFKPLAKVFLEAIRIRRSDQPVRPVETPQKGLGPAIGPFAIKDRLAIGDLLVFVPRSIESHLIDHMTGGYGYSHVAIDTGEVDLVTGHRVMVESTVNHPVWRVRQDRYGDRPYLRIHLGSTGIDAASFAECVKSKLGEQYDNLEALTWGAVDDPARQICSDLAADCLPPDLVLLLINRYRKGKLKRNSISIHQPVQGRIHAFISPNAFSQFFGGAPGNQIHKPGIEVTPIVKCGEISEQRILSAQKTTKWYWLAGGLAAGVIVLSLTWLARRFLMPSTRSTKG